VITIGPFALDDNLNLTGPEPYLAARGYQLLDDLLSGADAALVNLTFSRPADEIVLLVRLAADYWAWRAGRAGQVRSQGVQPAPQAGQLDQ
jgi:hypothetical protein